MGIEKYKRKKKPAKMTMAQNRQAILDVTDKAALLEVWSQLYKKCLEGNMAAIVEFNNRTMGKLQDSDIYEAMMQMQVEMNKLEAQHLKRLAERVIEAEVSDEEEENAAGDDGPDGAADEDDGGLRDGELP